MISTDIRRAGPYDTNGVQTVFAFDFKIFAAADLVVLFAADGAAEETLTLGSDYDVTLNADQDIEPGGEIEFVDAPEAGKVSMISALPTEQPAIFTNTGNFYPRVLNDSLDRVTIGVQQVEEKLTRTPIAPVTSDSQLGWIPVLDGQGGFIYVPPGDFSSEDPTLRVELAQPGGVALVGGAFALDVNGNLAIGLAVAEDALVQIETADANPNARGLSIEHYAGGIGNWALDIHAYEGSYGAFGIHCYTSRDGDIAGAVAAKFDHTRHGSILALSNARNQVTSPGTTGTADFVVMAGFPDTSVSLATNPVVLSQWTYQNIILTPQNAWPLTITGSGLVVNALSTSPRGLLVNQGATGIYASIMAGQNYGFAVSTLANGGQTLTVTKNGTGNGSAAVIVNEGTDPSIAGISGGAQGFAVYPNGDFYHGTTKVLGARGAALPGAASDPATTMALANAIRTCIQTHGLAA